MYPIKLSNIINFILSYLIKNKTPHRRLKNKKDKIKKELKSLKDVN